MQCVEAKVKADLKVKNCTAPAARRRLDGGAREETASADLVKDRGVHARARGRPKHLHQGRVRVPARKVPVDAPQNRRFSIMHVASLLIFSSGGDEMAGLALLPAALASMPFGYILVRVRIRCKVQTTTLIFDTRIFFSEICNNTGFQIRAQTQPNRAQMRWQIRPNASGAPKEAADTKADVPEPRLQAPGS